MSTYQERRDEEARVRSAIPAAETLEQLAALMGAVRRGPIIGDQEMAHVLADEILARAVHLLGGDQAQGLLADYDAIPKWFA